MNDAQTLVKRTPLLAFVLVLLTTAIALAAYTFRQQVPPGATSVTISVVTTYGDGTYTTSSSQQSVTAGSYVSVTTPYSSNDSTSGGTLSFENRNQNVSQTGFTAPDDPDCKQECITND